MSGVAEDRLSKRLRAVGALLRDHVAATQDTPAATRRAIGAGRAPSRPHRLTGGAIGAGPPTQQTASSSHQGGDPSSSKGQDTIPAASTTRGAIRAGPPAQQTASSSHQGGDPSSSKGQDKSDKTFRLRHKRELRTPSRSPPGSRRDAHVRGKRPRHDAGHTERADGEKGQEAAPQRRPGSPSGPPPGHLRDLKCLARVRVKRLIHDTVREEGAEEEKEPDTMAEKDEEANDEEEQETAVKKEQETAEGNPDALASSQGQETTAKRTRKRPFPCRPYPRPSHDTGDGWNRRGMSPSDVRRKQKHHAELMAKWPCKVCNLFGHWKSSPGCPGPSGSGRRRGTIPA